MSYLKELPIHGKCFLRSKISLFLWEKAFRKISMIRSKKMYGLQKVQMCILLPISTDLQSLMKKQKSDIVPLSVATQLSESMLW